MAVLSQEVLGQWLCMLLVKFGFCSESYLQSCVFFSELELKNEILEEKVKE